MARKAAIVFIIIFVRDGTLRTYLAMWTMTLAIGAHGWWQPYDPRRPSLYYLEGLGITTIVVTLNLALLFQFSYFEEGSGPYTTLVIFLVVINAITLVVFGCMIIYNTFIRVKNFFARRKAEKEAAERAEARARGEIVDSDDDDGKGDYDDNFRDVDRHNVQREGILGAIRRASRAHMGLQQEGPKTGKRLDVREVPKNENETPFERLQRLEAERKKQQQRDSHTTNQAELERDLEELRDHMLRAQALAAAEEAVVAKYPEVAEMRAKHEEELYRLMDEIRKERGDFATGGAAKIINKKEQPAGAAGTGSDSNVQHSDSVTARDSEDAFEMNFDDEEED